MNPKNEIKKTKWEIWEIYRDRVQRRINLWKKILTTLSFLTLGTTALANLNSFLNTNIHKNNFEKNDVQQKTQQDTIYIDQNGNKQTTNAHDLLLIKTKEIVQIGFYKNENGEIQVVRMPVTVEKVPNQLPSEITSLKNMFSSAFGFTEKFNQDISSWNTSNVIDMSSMFYGAMLFNQDISKWYTSKVTNMSSMFQGAQEFNQDISSWNTSNVRDMSSMFSSAISFNQNIGKWNTSKVTNMSAMFEGAKQFNQNIEK